MAADKENSERQVFKNAVGVCFENPFELFDEVSSRENEVSNRPP